MEREAVFHDEDLADLAALDVTREGIPGDLVLVEPGPLHELKPAPKHFLGLPHRFHGAAMGALLGFALGAYAGTTDDALDAMWLTVVGLFIGVFLGAAAGFLVGVMIHAHWKKHHTHQDYWVRVRARDSEEAERAERALVRSGGDLAAA
jgi:hypothetical protein